LVPIVAIWGLNGLFKTEIPYTLETWLFPTVLLLYLRFRQQIG
jgi:hypothetical protein